MDRASTHVPLERDTQLHVKPADRSKAAPFVWEDRYLQHSDLSNLPRSQDVFRKIEMDSCLSMALPKPGATPGFVLHHCVQTFENLHSKNRPMTFKFGFTHDASVRWHNPAFGYVRSKGDSYDHMLILYAASNPHGPSFLEAALIDHFGSFLIAAF